MSFASQTAATAAATGNMFVERIDPCILERATRGTLNSLLDAVSTWMYGSGLIVLIIMGVVGILMLVFGKTNWIKGAGVGIIVLIFLPAIISITQGMVTGGRTC